MAFPVWLLWVIFGLPALACGILIIQRKLWRWSGANLNKKVGFTGRLFEQVMGFIYVERYRTLFEKSPDAIFLLDSKGNSLVWRIIDCNDVACRMNGYNRDELIGADLNILHFVPCNVGERNAVIEELRQEQYVRYDNKYRRKDGSIYPVENVLHPISIGGRELLLLISRDITDRLEAERIRQESSEKYRTLFENSPDAMFLVEVSEDDPYWPIVDCNEAACRMNGYTREELIGQPVDILHVDSYGMSDKKKNLEKLREQPISISEFTHRRKDGTVFPVEIVKNLIVLNGKEMIVGIDRDITERKKAEETIKYQAYYDLLTKLPNKILLNDRLTFALAHAHRGGNVMSVIFLDLDRFKKINDTLGHDVGDQVLKTIAERLEACMREGETVARFGGDEFIILLPEVSRVSEVTRLAQDILDLFKQPLILSGIELYVTASMGIALYPNDGEQSEILLKNADAALNRAKEQGRNNFQFYTPLMNAKASERLVLESNLRRALKREEFVLFYQPQVNAKTGLIVGMEALIRWKHPELGLVSPAEFIPLAEETGLIIPIGEWVLKQACSQNKTWQTKGYYPIRVSVNISARQFQEQNIVEMVQRVLQETKLKPEYLELEITETIAMQNADYTVQILAGLEAMGVHISLDDFGTGYSSMGYLKRFPLDVLKIDRSFVQELLEDPSDAAIASSVIHLAHSLKLKVIAEGVETKEQVDFFQHHGCDIIQGFYFGRPMPAENFEKKLSSQTTD